jgi:hypothetical protein
MKTQVIVFSAAIAFSCGEVPEETKVEGSARGVSFQNPFAFYSAEPDGARYDPTVLISDDPDACSHLVKRRDGIALRGPDGKERPTLLMRMDGHSHLAPDRRELKEDLSAKLYPGGRALESSRVASDAWIVIDFQEGTEAPRAMVLPTRGEAFIRQVDRPDTEDAVARGTFDLRFSDDEFYRGEFVAKRCDPIVYSASGCSQAGAGAASLFGLLALGFALRGRSRQTG